METYTRGEGGRGGEMQGMRGKKDLRDNDWGKERLKGKRLRVVLQKVVVRLYLSIHHPRRSSSSSSVHWLLLRDKVLCFGASISVIPAAYQAKDGFDIWVENRFAGGGRRPLAKPVLTLIHPYGVQQTFFSGTYPTKPTNLEQERNMMETFAEIVVRGKGGGRGVDMVGEQTFDATILPDGHRSLGFRCGNRDGTVAVVVHHHLHAICIHPIRITLYCGTFFPSCSRGVSSVSPTHPVFKGEDHQICCGYASASRCVPISSSNN